MILKVFNLFVSKIKGESFAFDNNIFVGYLVCFLLAKLQSCFWGMLKMGSMRKVFVHRTSKIRSTRKIKFGKNLNVDRNCYIDALSTDGIRFGHNVSIGKNTTIECSGTLKWLGKGLVVGDNVGLGTHGFFGCAGGVEIGDNTIFGNYVSIHSENHNYSDVNTPIRLQGVNRKGIKIGKDCWIGAKATILDGTVLGDGCIVAAGAVVRGVIPPFSIIGGVPAKVIKSRLANA